MTHGDLDGLIRLIAQGDRAAFAALFRQAAPKVKGYLLRLGTAPPLADELAQEVMLTIWHKAGQFDPSRSSAMTWIFVIARNRRIDSLRRERSTVAATV